MQVCPFAIDAPPNSPVTLPFDTLGSGLFIVKPPVVATCSIVNEIAFQA